MSDQATKKDIKAAIKLIKGLGKEASGPEQFYLALAEEALDSIETQYYYRELNKKATKKVMDLYRDTSGVTGSMWNYVLGLLETDLRKRGG
jgi:hypothetical protein